MIYAILVLTLNIISSFSTVFSNPLPQGGQCSRPRCGAQGGQNNRPVPGWGGRYVTPSVDRATVSGEEPTIDVTEWINRFRGINPSHRRQHNSDLWSPRGRTHTRTIVGAEIVEQHVDYDRLGNAPFYFRWTIAAHLPAYFTIVLVPLTLTELVSRFSAVNHHVEVISYRIDWRLVSVNPGSPEVVIPPLETDFREHGLGEQTIYYERSNTRTRTAPVHWVPDRMPAWSLADFYGRGHTFQNARIRWNATITFEL